MSETSAGSIIATLSLSITDFEENIAKAQALADHLDGKNVNVQVKVDDAGAEAKLAGVAASEDRVDTSNKKVASSSGDASKGLGLMSMAIVGLAPAIVPLAAGAAGLAVGFGAMGAAGILAIVGIKEQMAAGTPVGGAYTSMVGTLTGDLHQLGATAAAGVLGPFQREVAALQTQMPALNGIIGEFSVITGKTAGNLMSGLVAAFIALEPLARDVGVYVLDLSSKFSAMMSGPGVVSFGDYIRSVFPQVMQTVESVVTAAVRLIAALAPLGGGVLSELKMFSDVINALPVDVLSTLATVGASVFIGFKSFSLLSTGITAVGVALKAVGVSAETAATGMLAMNVAAGAVGALVAIAMLAFSALAGSTQQATQAANDYADALKASNGAIDDNIRQMTAKSLSDSGALANARQLGISLSTVTDAALGNATAMAAVTAVAVPMIDAFDKASMSTGTSTAATAKNGQAAKDLLLALRGTNGELNSGIQTYKDIAAATDASAAATGTATTATLLGMNAQQQSESQNKSQIATIKALNAAMDEEISKELQLAGATSNVDQATLTMTTTLKANNLTMDEHTQKGIDDRRAIEGVVGSLQSQRDANIKSGMSTADATTKYEAASAALLDQTGKMYGTTSQAYLYIKQLLGIPADVKTDLGITGDVVAKSKISAVQQKIDGLPGNKVIDVAIKWSNSAYSVSGIDPKTHLPVGFAGGGQIDGVGTGTSDSNLILGSKGEHMLTADDVNAAGGQGAVYAWRKSLHAPAHAVAAGVQALAAGGPLPLPAGIAPDSQVNSLKKVLS